MSDQAQKAQTTKATTTPQVPRQRGTEPSEPVSSAWTGWLTFGAMMLIMVGAFQVIAGLTALFDDGFYIVTSDQLLVSVDFTAWGWTHLALGALAIAAGFGIMAGQMWARVVGVGLALLSSIVNLAFLPAYPLWSMLVIALDVVVIYALIAHGAEMKTADY
ncbi:MAG TPA: hypothetical protein VLA97_08135 [Nocardioidaceae bacterium]|nr:hypothetical protein [Nocardioidaceae bacterium]